MAAPVDIGYVVGYTVGMLIELGWKAIGLVVTNPLSHMNLLLQTQSGDPDIINGHSKHFVMTLTGIKFWYKQRGFTGLCRMVPFDVFTPNLSVDAGGLWTLFNPFYPIETLRTILASDISTKLWKKTRSHLVSFTEMKDALSNLHPFVYFSGYVTNIIGTICYRLIYFSVYGVLRETDFSKKDSTSSFLVAQFAVMAGLLGRYPFETISRRMQVQACLSPSDRVYRNAWDCLTKIVSVEGIPGLYKGVGLSLLRTVVAGTLMLLVWHTVQRDSSSNNNSNNDDDSSMVGNILNHEDRVSDPIVRIARRSSGRQPPLEMLWFHVQWTNGNVDSWEPYSRVKNSSILNQYVQDHGLVTSESILSAAGMTQKSEVETDELKLGFELEARKARVKAALARARMSLS